MFTFVKQRRSNRLRIAGKFYNVILFVNIFNKLEKEAITKWISGTILVCRMTTLNPAIAIKVNK